MSAEALPWRGEAGRDWMTAGRRLTCVLLVVQAANALLASVPQVVAFQALGGAIGSLGLLFLASGVWREWRWAWRAVVLVEVLMLLGTAPRLVQALVAQQMPDGGWLLGCIGLPVGVLVSRRIKGDVPLVAGLLVASAVLHLALAGEHGLAFALDGVLLLGALRWRWAAPWVLVFNLVAYGVAVGPGKEAVDALGVSTKLLELVALGLVLGQSRRGTLALLASTVLVGGVAWAATFRDHGFAAHSHNPATASPPDVRRAGGRDSTGAGDETRHRAVQRRGRGGAGGLSPQRAPVRPVALCQRRARARRRSARAHAARGVGVRAHRRWAAAGRGAVHHAAARLGWTDTRRPDHPLAHPQRVHWIAAAAPRRPGNTGGRVPAGIDQRHHARDDARVDHRQSGRPLRRRAG